MVRQAYKIPNWLSLDAPLVAVGWSITVSRAVGQSFAWPAMIVLFLTVWLIYAVDRLLDIRKLDFQQHVTQRHQFVAVHARWFWKLWWIVLMFTTWVAVSNLESAIWWPGLGILTLVILY